jgi:hypothetical protein
MDPKQSIVVTARTLAGGGTNMTYEPKAYFEIFRTEF